MIVGDLIGGPVSTCAPGLGLGDAARQMLADDVGSLAVLKDRDLVGIITERDVMRVVAEGRSVDETRVAEAMTPAPDSLGPDVKVEDAADWMMAAGYRHLPVLEGGDLVGMISIKDVLWALTEQRIDRQDSR